MTYDSLSLSVQLLKEMMIRRKKVFYDYEVRLTTETERLWISCHWVVLMWHETTVGLILLNEFNVYVVETHVK